MCHVATRRNARAVPAERQHQGISLHGSQVNAGFRGCVFTCTVDHGAAADRGPAPHPTPQPGSPTSMIEVSMIRIAAEPALSLSEVRPHDSIRIERILYESLRDRCAGIGLHEGDQLRCRQTSSLYLLLETETGRSLMLDQDWARFIRVRRTS
jgi:hypothetical protein